MWHTHQPRQRNRFGQLSRSADGSKNLAGVMVDELGSDRAHGRLNKKLDSKKSCRRDGRRAHQRLNKKLDSKDLAHVMDEL
jgi:hypothetical protein